MSQVFPLRTAVELDEDRGPRLVDLADDAADDVFAALSSGTARTILAELHESPQAASDLAEVTDTSVQNVQYHLENLGDVDLVEVVDTWYSERGTEMKVYAPTDDALVLFAGSQDRTTLKDLLFRALAGVGLLAPATALVWLAADRLLGDPAGSTPEPAGGGGGGGIGIQTVEEGAGAAAGAAGTDPALVAAGAFLLGGLVVLTVALGLWYRRR